MKNRTLRLAGLLLYSGILSYGIWKFDNIWLLAGLLPILIIGESET